MAVIQILKNLFIDPPDVSAGPGRASPARTGGYFSFIIYLFYYTGESVYVPLCGTCRLKQGFSPGSAASAVYVQFAADGVFFADYTGHFTEHSQGTLPF